MSRIERWGVLLVLVAAGAGGFALWLHAHDKATVEQARVVALLGGLQASIDSLREVERHWDTVMVRGRGELTTAIGRVQANSGPSIPRADVDEVVRACTFTLDACVKKADAASARADSAERKAKLLEARVNPRWRLFAEGGYDPLLKDARIGAGTELRVVGQLHLTGRLDWRQPTDSARGSLSSFAGLRWYF